MVLPDRLERRRTVLVVEDQEINRDILGSILEDQYDVIYAENGQEGLDVLRARVSEISIVMLDLIMPVMDGYEVLRRVRKDPALSHVPIIVLTAEKAAELLALQLGAADFVTKPFDMHEVILARVARIIELTEGRQLILATEYDPLTRLYTKGFFFQYAEQINRFYTDWHMDAVVLNVDRFHSVNDLNGREFGDRLLSLIGEEIQLFLTETKGIASRMEADQFYLYCLHRDDYHSVLSRFQNRVNLLSHKVSLRLRMGVSPYAKGMGLERMFDRAKTACNMVRGSFRRHLMIYDDTIHQREMYYQRLLNDLQDGVKYRQFRVFYQPKYNIQVDPPRLASAEALIRWEHPELGMISPGEFIPLFERDGMIQMVDTFVWEETARQIAAWKRRYGITLPVSVNLSRTDVFDPELEEQLLALIRANGLSPGDMKLEVTESAYTDDARQLIAVITKLREDGFQIEMDDFGSGYSSLNMISTLPIDVLKMDMKFIQNIEQNSKDFRLIELVLDIAKYLNVPVVAEGVETENQLQLLRSAKCDLVQGYYFSKPLPAEEFEALIRKDLQLEKEMST